MVLLEGRKEDIYNKYKGQIDADRKLDSSFEPLSIYDILIGEPFLQQTNYKYLEPLVQQYFFNNEVYPRQGKELEELEPNHPNTAINSETKNTYGILLLWCRYQMVYDNEG